MIDHVPYYLCDRDVLHSYTLWSPEVWALEKMWKLPARKPVYGLASWQRRAA